MKKVKENASMIINGIIMGLSFGIILIITDQANIKKEQLNLLLIVGLLTLIISNYIHIIIHEIGHLIFGLLSGYKFVSFRIASLMLIKIDNKLNFKKFSLLGTAGQCLMEPPKLVDNKIPVILYNYGGVIMNTIASMITLILSYFSKNIILLKYSLELFSIIGIYFALTNGIPLKFEINNDGLNAILLLKNKDAQKSFWVQLMVNAEQTKGKRIKNMPEEWFCLPTNEKMKNDMTATMGVLYCGKLLDEHKFKDAKEAINKVLKNKNNITRIHRSLLKVNIIYCELLEGNIEKVLKLLTDSQKKFMRATKSFPSIIRTEYAIARIIDKDTEKSNRILNNFEQLKKKYPYKADIESEEELINIIKNKEKNE